MPGGATDGPAEICRRGAAVHLIASAEDARLVSASLTPYCEWHSVPASDQCWTVISAGTTEPGTGFREVESGTFGTRAFLGESTRTVILAADDREVRCLVVRRLVKALLRRELDRSQEVVWTHAAAVAVDGAAVVLIGNKRSGKTTMALSLLATPRAGYIGNSDVSMHLDVDGVWRAAGWPRALTIRRDTFDLLARLHPSFDPHALAAAHPNNDLPRDAGAIEEPDKLYVMPQDLPNLVGKPLVPDAQAVLLVFPEFSAGEDDAMTLTKLTAAETRAELLQVVDSTPDRFHPYLDGAFAERKTRSSGVRLSEQVPGVKLRYGAASASAAREAVVALSRSARRGA